MALSQKYTWGDFLKEHPEIKKKGLKRKDPKVAKDFETAFKKQIASYLKEREADLKKEKERASKCKEELLKALKRVEGDKWYIKARKLNQKIGRFDSYLAKVENRLKHTLQLSKAF